ncbi:MAG: DUF4080 domain-containing protein [Rhodocyclaceae bacterium]|nr:MAG: DUF4080 domain-containing protein [Rhodocyclaceae bacterium]
MTIILSTVNARYTHASLGLRYLRANLGELKEQTQILEFVSGLTPGEMVEQLLARRPRIIGFGVYIWNVAEITRVVAILKRLAPDITIILGGPEVSFETAQQAIVSHADYVITGWGEISLPRLCRQILGDDPQARPVPKIQPGVQAALEDLALPYALYSDQDIAHRTLYVEASRGCPFKCEFCLSALDKTAWPFDLERFLGEIENLHARGARRFKFVDRTFNLNIRTSRRILNFFLNKIVTNPDDPVFAHFEVVPDHLPETLTEIIAKFPPGTLQFEIGIQSWNPEVQALVSRRQDNDSAAANLRWLREHTRVHLHVDLIAGLPGEDLASFARGFDRLYALGPHEIQVGVLKRLRGTPIIRHTKSHGLVFDPDPPYSVLATDRIDFHEMQRLKRFARYWDLVANSGRFANTLPAMLGNAPFDNFMNWSDWLYSTADTTHGISLDRLVKLLVRWLQARGWSEGAAKSLLAGDYAGQPVDLATKPLAPRKAALPKRQAQHLAD